MSSPSADVSGAKRAIRDRIIEMADRRRIDARGLKDNDVIPETGVLDSAGILELVIWVEMTFGVTIDQSDLTLDNFGTIDAMVSYLRRAKSN
jgi:D-alanine--poly(phosphoribitol) ligase subunit 2